LINPLFELLDFFEEFFSLKILEKILKIMIFTQAFFER